MTEKVIKTQFGEFTSEQIKELLSTELGKKVRSTLSSEKKLERDKKLAEAKARMEKEKQQVELLTAASGLTIPENVFVKKIGVTNKSETYKDVYINFRIDDDTPHVMTIPVSGDVSTQEDLNEFADRIMKAKLHLLLLVSKLG